MEGTMIFKRKAYAQLLTWKQQYANDYALLIEGAKGVGKTTLAVNFAKNEYESFLLIDFSNTKKEVLACFDDLTNLDLFYFKLGAVTNSNIEPYKSVIIFDEIQLFPKARQAIKHLIADGRYHFIETGSLISIRQNLKDILIPSEEMKLQLYPLDYEEFLQAVEPNKIAILDKIYQQKVAIGQDLNRKLMKDFRLYMALGGMPQVVEAYLNKKSFSQIEVVKQNIIALYLEDLYKIDKTGALSEIYKSIPSQLSKDAKKFVISKATNKRSSKDNQLEQILTLADSKITLTCYDVSSPSIDLVSSKRLDKFKLYIADIGLFVSLMFGSGHGVDKDVYTKLLSDKLPSNLGFLYENVVAQLIASSGSSLFYHTWNKEQSAHYYEIDFLVPCNSKLVAIEVKSSRIDTHSSIDAFLVKFSNQVKEGMLVSQKEYQKIGNIVNYPFYLLQHKLNELQAN